MDENCGYGFAESERFLARRSPFRADALPSGSEIGCGIAPTQEERREDYVDGTVARCDENGTKCRLAR